MTCDDVELELIGFQLGTLPLELRREVERHLMECPGCLSGHLAMKRQADRVEATPAPSEISRERLRRTVASAVAPKRTLIPPRWERPVALVLAAAALLLAITSTHGLYTRPTTPPRTAPVSLLESENSEANEP